MNTFHKCFVFFACAFLACSGSNESAPQTPKPLDPVAIFPTATVEPTSAPTVDLLGSKPELSQPKAFETPIAEEFEFPNHMKVKLIEKHSLPLVSIYVVFDRANARTDRNSNLPGISHITTDMLDEGAGKRDAVGISDAIQDLGAHLNTGNGPNGSVVSISVIKKNLGPALDILYDVVAKPRFEKKDWNRVSSLWVNELKQRKDDPASVARVVAHSALFGPAGVSGHIYSHPMDGLLSYATQIKLEDVKKFYQENYRPAISELIVVGDISKKELLDFTKKLFASWKAKGKSDLDFGIRPSITNGPTPEEYKTSWRKWDPPKFVFVDKPDAAQSVILVIREGLEASDKKMPYADLLNTVFGGSFTSRLNQNLREDHHYTYGASSRFTETRSTGSFSARASVHVDVTGAALKEMLAELNKMSKLGVTEAELEKSKAQARSDAIQNYETTSSMASRLATLSMLTYDVGFDRTFLKAQNNATLDQVNEFKLVVDPTNATIVIVGPKSKVLPQLTELNLGAPQFWDEEGNPLNP